VNRGSSFPSSYVLLSPSFLIHPAFSFCLLPSHRTQRDAALASPTRSPSHFIFSVNAMWVCPGDSIYRSFSFLFLVRSLVSRILVSYVVCRSSYKSSRLVSPTPGNRGPFSSPHFSVISGQLWPILVSLFSLLSRRFTTRLHVSITPAVERLTTAIPLNLKHSRRVLGSRNAFGFCFYLAFPSLNSRVGLCLRYTANRSTPLPPPVRTIGLCRLQRPSASSVRAHAQSYQNTLTTTWAQSLGAATVAGTARLRPPTSRAGYLGSVALLLGLV
jgi:hypothetical protein